LQCDPEEQWMNNGYKVAHYGLCHGDTHNDGLDIIKYIWQERISVSAEAMMSYTMRCEWDDGPLWTRSVGLRNVRDEYLTTVCGSNTT